MKCEMMIKIMNIDTDGDDGGEMMKCEMMIKIMNIDTDGEYEGGMEAKSGVKWRRKMVKWKQKVV